MKKFRIVPAIEIYSTIEKFLENFSFSSDDLVFSSSSTLKYFKDSLNGASVILRGDYGTGEPSDILVEKIHG